MSVSPANIEVVVAEELETVEERDTSDIHLYQDNIPFEKDRICKRIQANLSSVLEGIIQVGRDLIWAKRVLPHGEFEWWLRKDVGLSRQRASEFMRIAERVLHSQTPDVKAFLQQTSGGSKHKMLSLLDVTDEEMEDAIQEDAFLSRPLDEIEAMSVRELRDALKSEKDKQERAHERAEEAERRAIDAESDLQNYLEADGDPRTIKPDPTLVMPTAVLGQLVIDLGRCQRELMHWIEDPDTWLPDSIIPDMDGLLDTIEQKSHNIRSLCSNIEPRR